MKKQTTTSEVAPILSIGDVQLFPPKSWEKFEQLVRDLQRAEHGGADFQLNGRSGQGQNGVDSYGWVGSLNGYVGIQCKLKFRNLKKSLSIRELRDEVRKAKSFRPKLKKYIVATTSPRDVALQEEARKITNKHYLNGGFSVHVCAWDDVEELFARHSDVCRDYYGFRMATSNDAHQPLLPVHTISEILDAESQQKGSPSADQANIRILSARASHALGLLATCPLPCPKEAMERFFPDVSWDAIIPELLAAKAVSVDESIFRVSAEAKSHVFPQRNDESPFTDAWLKVLEPLQHHVDVAMFLIVLYVRNEENGKAFDLAIEIAQDLERGHWNSIFINILGPFQKAKFQSGLSPSKQRDFYSTFGGCLARSNNPKQAIPWAKKLMMASSASEDHCGISQAHLLLGLAYQNSNQADQAAKSYEACIRHAKRHRNYLHLGHSLHNLAMLIGQDDPDKAEALLDQSISAKKKAGDEVGRVGALFGRGSLAIQRKKFTEAVKWFDRAAKLAAKWELLHSRALALSNIGNALVDQGKPRESLAYYTAAMKIAEDEGYPDASAFAIEGSANANLALKRYRKAHDYFLRLKDVRKEMEDHESAVVAYHDAGTCLLFNKQPAEARAMIAAAYEEAVQHNFPEWMYRCAKDSALTYLETGDVDRTLDELRRAAEREGKNGQSWVAANLWETVAALLLEHRLGSSEIESAFENAIASLKTAPEHFDECFRPIGGLFQYRWEAGLYDKAMDTLRMMEAAAQTARNREMQLRAIDQIGMCLQELGKVAEAIPLHRRALHGARRFSDTELAENCLNNLGEAMRKTGKSAAAIALYEEGEEFARKRGDSEMEISIAHNRALALEDLGHRPKAHRVLLRCRNIAEKSGLTEQYVRALHGLANHAWLTSKADDAIAGYREALRNARRYQFGEQIVSIAVNLADALRYNNRSEEALHILESVFDLEVQSPERHVYLSVVAAAATDVGDTNRATDAYRGAMQASTMVNDIAYLVSASQGLSTLLENNGDLDEADTVLKTALMSSITKEQHIAILTQRMCLLRRAGKNPQAGTVFKQIKQISSEGGFHEELVDVQIQRGDLEWEHGKSQVEALKYYIAAMVSATEVEGKVMITVGTHAIQRLLSMEIEGREQQIGQMDAALRKWLTKEVPPSSISAAEKFLLWPLRVALRITCEPDSRKRRNVEWMVDLVEAELRGE